MSVYTVSPTRHRVRVEFEGMELDEYFRGSKTQAKQYEARQFLAMRSGEYVDPRLSKIKFAAFIDEHYWKARNKKGVAASSLEREKGVVNRMVERWGNRSLRSIQTVDLEKFLESSANSDATKTRERGICSVVFGTAVKLKLIPINPATGLELTKNDEEPQEREIPTLSQLEAIVEALEPRFRAMALCMAWCGLRPGESAAIRRCDVLLDSSELWIRKSVFEPQVGKPYLVKPKTKSSVARIEMPSKLKRQMAQHILEFGITEPDGLLFPGADGGPLRLRSWRRGPWARACRAAGVEFSPHSLRHLFVSLLIDQGFGVEKVSRMARHKSPMVTWTIYAHELQRPAGEVSPAVAALDRLMAK